MKKWLYRIIWIPVLVLAVLFLIANRQMVTISLDPINASEPAITSFPLPLWMWLVTTLFIGVGLGAVGMWASGSERRHKAHAEHKELKALKRDHAALQHRYDEMRPKPAEMAAEPPLLESVDP